MTRAAKRRDNRCLFILLLCFCCILFLASCPGNGGASDTSGTTYAAGGGGTPGAGGMTGQNNKEPSAWDIKNMADAGDTDKIVELLSGGQEDTGGDLPGEPVRVTMAASDLGLPAGGWVVLKMTVDGESDSYKAVADADGNVAFDIPMVPEGSEVSVRMDVRDGSGALVRTGRTEKTVSGTDDALKVTLEPLLTKSESASGSKNDTITIAFPTSSQPGTSSGLLELSDIDCQITSATFMGDAISINNSKTGLTATVYVALEGTNRATGTHGGALHVAGNSGAVLNIVFCTSSEGSLSLDTTNTSNAKISVVFVPTSFSVMEGCSVHDMRISDDAGFNIPYTDFSEFIEAAQADYTPGHKAVFSIRRD